VTPDELRAALDRLGLSQRGGAKALEVDERTMRRWIAGAAAIPGPVQVALRCMAQLRRPGDADQ
jgi:hypothetical protein